MSTKVSRLADVDHRAELGRNVEIGPFCVVGSGVTIGDGTRLESHAVIIGRTTIGKRNRFFPGTVIGSEPQDSGYRDAPTRLDIGDDNIFREGVTVNRGAEKEDHTTRVGNGNLFMANSHVAHNCRIGDRIILVNGVLLGGHVHVHDKAIVSGNSVVHHFSTLGTLCFVSGGCRVPADVAPYMLAAGSDKPSIRTINRVGLSRHGVSPETINVIKRAHRLVFRERRNLETVRRIFDDELDGAFPLELETLLDFLERTRNGKLGRARETLRNQPQAADGGTEPRQETTQRRAA